MSARPPHPSRTRPCGIDFESFEGRRALWAGLRAMSSSSLTQPLPPVEGGEEQDSPVSSLKGAKASQCLPLGITLTVPKMWGRNPDNMLSTPPHVG